METFASSITVINQVYFTTCFVRGVVSDIASYERGGHDIQAKLEHESFFLETFKALFFDDKNAFMDYKVLPTSLTHDLAHILSALSKTLSEYGLIASKHGIDVHNVTDRLSADDSEDSSDSAPGQGPDALISRYRKRLKARIKHLKPKLDRLDWALFDKGKITKLLNEYGEWAERLRQVMTLMLLVNGRLGSSETRQIAEDPVGRALGLNQAAQRQLQAGSEPANLPPLRGKIRAVSQVSGLMYQTGEYFDASGFGALPVILEQHKFNPKLGSDHPEDEQRQLHLKLVKALAWLLHSAGANADENKIDDGTDLKGTLQCIGYLENLASGAVTLAYRLPTNKSSVKSIMTLHDYIACSNADSSPGKPPLEDRFFLAHNLCMTLFEVHSSGWVHKNVRSRSVVLFADPDSKGLLTPYLVGWGIARPQDPQHERASAATNEDNEQDLEANIYRHPERYGKPSTHYSNKHDLYALGVVLLEIGLWQTMSSKFARPIAIAKEKESLPPASMKHMHLMELCNKARLKQEMGTRYAKVVERCLTTDFQVEGENERGTALTRNFRELAVEQVKPGNAL